MKANALGLRKHLTLYLNNHFLKRKTNKTKSNEQTHKSTKAKRKTRLNDNEVREVAKMQMVIDHYEDSLFRLSMFAEGRGDGIILVHNTDGDFWLRKLYKFIEEHKEKKQ